MKAEAFEDLRKLLAVEPWEIHCEFRVGSKRDEVPWQTVERLVRRYAIMETTNRAVILLDIVGFSKLTSIQRIAQLNSLEYSINISQRLLQQNGLSVELAKSTTGDGFYIWNRETGADGEYRAVHRPDLHSGRQRPVPYQGHQVLRARCCGRPSASAAICHTIRSTGMMPRGYDYIVGDVTISLARLIEKARPKQVLIGEFKDTSGEAHAATEHGRVHPKDQAADPQVPRRQPGQYAHQRPQPVAHRRSDKPRARDRPGKQHRRNSPSPTSTASRHDAYNVHIAVERSGSFPLYLGDEEGLAGP